MRSFRPGIDSTLQQDSSSNPLVAPFFDGEEFAVMDIADFLETHGPCQAEGGDVGSKCSSIQAANASSPKLLKYPKSKLRPQTRLPKLLFDGDVFGPGEVSSEFFPQIHQNQRGMFKINQIEARDLVPVQRHETQLPSRECFYQSTT